MADDLAIVIGYTTEDRAIAAWNRRVPAPDLVEALQKTVASLENCVKRLRAASKFAGNDDWAIDGLCEQFEAQLTDARATLSKALGEGEGR